MAFLMLTKFFLISLIRNRNLVGCITALVTGHLLFNPHACVPTQCSLRRIHGDHSGEGTFSSPNTSVFPVNNIALMLLNHICSFIIDSIRACSKLFAPQVKLGIADTSSMINFIARDHTH